MNSIIPRNKCSNGRVDVYNKPAGNTANLFAMYDKIPVNQCTTYRNATEGIWTETLLSTAFFSASNIRIIQNGIRAGVFNQSNKQYIIADQDCDALKIIMRSVFLQHAANEAQNIPGQIKQLNQVVLDYCILHVYNEAQGYMKYLTDVGTLAVPMSNPVMEEQNGRRVHKLPNWF